MSKVLFLDIDGVVLPGRAYLLPNQTKPIVKTFDPCAVSILNEIVQVCDLKIVVHSSWIRTSIWHIDSPNDPDVIDHCVSQGIPRAQFHEDWRCNGDISWRYDRVREWLSRHPEVTDYVIVDDEPLSEEHSEFKTRFYQTDFDNGLTMDLLRKIHYDLLHPHQS